ncbi:MAG: hypothetical protein LBQ22_13115 [Bacteroidales bacterium]|jgi:hypothetical protein|nr:hypothetical protein [Bacteroidales bacterium]
MEFNIKITIEANDSNEANQIIKSLLAIYKHLSTEDLIAVAGHIEKDPKIINKVKSIADNPFVKTLFNKK